MKFLIVLAANIEVLTNMAHVSNNNRLDSIAMQSRNKMSCLFVLNLFDLISQFLELPLFGFDEVLATTGAFLLPVNAPLKLGFQLILILSL